MNKQFIENWKFEQLVKDAVCDYLALYNLKKNKNFEEGIEFENEHVVISITYRYGEFNFTISRNNNVKTIGDFIFFKYPKYSEILRENPNLAVFKFQQKDFENIDDYFKYLVKTTFDFLSNNFPYCFS